MIERQEHDGIVTLRLAHGKASAMDLELLDALTAEFQSLRVDGTRAIVLTGSGTIFSAGVDLPRLTAGGAAYVERFLPALDAAFQTIFDCDRPVVAAVNGHAIAGGCILAQCADYRVMADGKGRIGAPELLVGVQFPPLALEILRFVVAPQHLQKLILTGATLLPSDALQHGLVDEVVDAERLDERARSVAEQLAAIPRDVFANTKRHLRLPVAEAMSRRAAGISAESAAIWRDPSTHRNIETYLARTLKPRA